MKLVLNTPIRMKYDYKKRHPESVKQKREKKRRTETTENPETTYFLWFLSLKLLLEMEELKLGLQKPKTDKKFIIGKDIKIDKKFYKKWDLDDVLNQPFHKWWKTHRELFETPSTVDIDNLNGWSPKPHFRYLRVDTRNNYTNIKREVLEGIDDLVGQKVDKVSQFPVTGKPRYDNEIITYNLLIRKLNGEDNESIFEIEKGRFKNIDKPDKGGSYFEKKGLDGKVKVLSESELWGSYREYMKLTPKEREIQYKKVRKEDVSEREEGIYRTRRLKTEGLRIGSEFRSALTLEINRYMKDYQQILNGVAQGIYREKIEF
ncbi:MAG: hypothetical protein H8D80_02335 [Proteobacteria bacterium]|nr:hypothetical protein [Pseudomonadota bacterium]